MKQQLIQKQKPKLIPLIKIFINNSGDICLTSGTCNDMHESCSTSGDNSFIVRNSTNSNVIFINSTGSLCLVGGLYEKSNDIDTGEYDLVYDANGNLISGFGKIYTYNDFNQLTQVNNSEGQLIASYTYDQDGNRIVKRDYPSNTTTYYIDASFIQVRNSSGVYNETYYYDSRDLVAKKDNNNQIVYYHPDHLGSTSLITNQSGDVVENSFYMPYGEVISGGESRYDYEGKETDETGLQYFGARYYDSSLTIFTQPDSIIPDVYDPQQLNAYAFERRNPYTYVDEDGHESISQILPMATTLGSSILHTFGTYSLIKWRTNIETSSTNLLGQLGLKAYDTFVKSTIDASYWLDVETKSPILRSIPGYTEPSKTEMIQIREKGIYGTISTGLTVASFGISNVAIKILSNIDLVSSLVFNKGIAEQAYEGYKEFSEPPLTQQGREPSLFDKVINFFGGLFE